MVSRSVRLIATVLCAIAVIAETPAAAETSTAEPAHACTPLTLGAQPIDGEGATCYTFEATAGEPYWFRAPAGTEIVYPRGQVRLAACGGVCRFNQTGTFTLRARSESGEYWVAVDRLTRPGACQSVSPGFAARSMSFNGSGRFACLAFDGRLHDNLTVAGLPSGNSGLAVALRGTDATNGDIRNCARVDRCTLRWAGRWYLVLTPLDRRRQELSLRLQRWNDLTEPDGCTTKGFGNAPSVVLGSSPRAWRCFTFVANAGDRIAAYTPGASPVFVDDAGNETRSNCPQGLCTYDAPRRGRYYVLLTGGGRTIALQRLNAPRGCRDLAFGERLPATLSLPGELHCYAVPPAGGFEIETSGPELAVRGVRPGGELTSVCRRSAGAVAGCPSGLATGARTVLVHPSDGAQTGPYELSATAFAVRPGCKPLRSFGSISPVGETDCYAFTISQERSLELSAIENSGNVVLRQSVEDAAARELCASTTNETITCTLPPGEYRWILQADGPNQTGTYELIFPTL